ncbi:MAG TPA: hypothetical protein VEA69_18825 [Tepidisphaeraceae bacterium]|nr:hypothetical protein [Tepidisphaeraceae bacterium]
MALVRDDSEILKRELDAAPDSFVGRLRFELRWDSTRFAELCGLLRAAADAQRGAVDLPRGLSQLFWYCGTFIPTWVRQRDFTVGQSGVNYDEACTLLKRLGDAWFCGDDEEDDEPISEEELAGRLAAVGTPNARS